MLISIVLVFSILIVIAYILSMNQKEWFPGAGEWFNVFFQLSIGFIINFIFYITQVYFPQQKQQKQAYKCIALRIKQIISYMNDIFIQLGEIYLDDYCSGNDITDEQLLIILNKLNINEEVHVINPRKIGMTNQHFTTKEWIVSQVEFIRPLAKIKAKR